MDIDGSPIIVGRAYYKGDHLPAKVVPSRNVAYVCWNGKEYDLQSCEIMIQHFGNFTWLSTNGGIVPPIAVPVGSTRDGEVLYAGRAYHNGSLCIGKVHPSHGCCYIPFGGKEHSYKHYEILVKM